MSMSSTPWSYRIEKWSAGITLPRIALNHLDARYPEACPALKQACQTLTACRQNRSQDYSMSGAYGMGLRPNNSFKPSPLRGLGAGAKIVPTPRPLSGPA